MHLTSDNDQLSSCLFTSTTAVNPLVAAAGPLLHLASQLKEQLATPDYDSLHQTLLHEIKVFEQRGLQAGFRSPIVLAARYLISALIDEIILTSSWQFADEWEKRTLRSTFQLDEKNEDRFFDVLGRAAHEPQQHIELLELGYLCLSMDYQGKYRQISSVTHFEYEQFIENLYLIIRKFRGDVQKKLFINATNIKK